MTGWKRTIIFEHSLLSGSIEPEFVVRVIVQTDPHALCSSASRVVGDGREHLVLVVVGFHIVHTLPSLKDSISRCV